MTRLDNGRALPSGPVEGGTRKRRRLFGLFEFIRIFFDGAGGSAGWREGEAAAGCPGPGLIGGEAGLDDDGRFGFVIVDGLGAQ